MSCCGGCNKNPCACNVVPLPYYEDSCYQENQCQGVQVVVQYTPVIRVSNAWAVPEFDQIVTLKTPGIVDMLIGSILSNPEYGDYEVVSFDQEGQSIKVKKAYYNDVEPGISIIACTKFILTSSTQVAYLSERIDELEDTLNELIAIVDDCCGGT